MSLYIGRNHNRSKQGNPKNQEEQNRIKFGLGGNNQKFGANIIRSAEDLANDTLNSVEEQAKGVFKSIQNLKDNIIGNNKRDSEDDNDFIKRERSIANRHKDAITNILNDTFNGNLFDAGVSVINLANTGTKWKTYLDQYVDKDSYAFKYFYFYDPLGLDDVIDDTEVSSANPAFLDLIEDPTILGYSLRIDYENSPLFINVNSNTINNFIEDTEVVTSQNFEPISLNSAINFITTYSTEYSELSLAHLYLLEFKEGIQKIFTSPEILTNYKDPLKKNHYINSIEGLEKLDNYFVNYGSSDLNSSAQKESNEFLTITLQEDIRMFTNRLAFLYRNLSWSYNMGKKLIPENLLRFNLYIKIADYRNFTRDGESEISKSIREKYSRVIYELKDCEMFFDSSLNPSQLTMSGFESVNSAYSQLKMKIKYRKVNRIFYSTMFDSVYAPFLIGDKFYSPNTERTFVDLQAIGFGGDKTKKRKSTSNNFDVPTSIDERIDRLKNRGLFPSNDNDDTALTRFVKSVGNTAVKAGFELIDEGLQKVKQELNSFQPFGSGIRNILQGNIGTKTLNLGDVHPNINQNIQSPFVSNLHPISGKDIEIPTEDLHPTLNKDIEVPNEDLHGVGDAIDVPTEDLHPNTNYNVTAPTEDLHGNGSIIIPPTEDLHDDINNIIIPPNESLHGIGENITVPTEDLHDSVNNVITPPNEILQTSGDIINNPNENLHNNNNGNIITNPTEDFHLNTNNNIESPDIDLHNTGDNNISSPNEKLHTTSTQIISPNEDLHLNTNNNIESPNIDLHNTIDNNNSSPNEKLHNKDNININNPDEDRHIFDFRKFIKKDPPPNDTLNNPNLRDLDNG